ncbi:unnamed protein product, partial [Polarella glacialis]
VAVFCDDVKSVPFPEAAHFMQEFLGLPSTKALDIQDWDQDKGSKDNAPRDVQVLTSALQDIDDPAYALWSFAVCTVPSGEHAGTRAVAIGSNVKKRERAGNLALALTVACKLSSVSKAGPAGGPAGRRFAELADSVRGVFHAPRPGPPPQPSPAPLQPVMQPAEQGKEQGLEAPAPPPPPPPAPSPVRPLSPPRSAPATAATSANIRAASADSDRSEVIVFGQLAQPAASPRTVPAFFAHQSAVVHSNPSAAWLGPEVHSQQGQGSAVGRWRHQSKKQVIEQVAAAPSPLPAGQEDGPETPLSRNSLEQLNEQLRQGLLSLRGDTDTLTIRTFGSDDTIPLGTDLDAQCYNNLWAAAMVTDTVGKMLVTSNLGWRVLDAENLGYTYGDRVLGRRSRHFAIQGVQKAVQYFQRQCISVIAVGQRQDLPKLLAEEVEQGNCEVVVADNADDAIILKMAFDKKCPIVSRDLYRNHQTDLRLNRELYW